MALPHFALRGTCHQPGVGAPSFGPTFYAACPRVVPLTPVLLLAPSPAVCGSDGLLCPVGDLRQTLFSARCAARGVQSLWDCTRLGNGACAGIPSRPRLMPLHWVVLLWLLPAPRDFRNFGPLQSGLGWNYHQNGTGVPELLHALAGSVCPRRKNYILFSGFPQSQ